MLWEKEIKNRRERGISLVLFVLFLFVVVVVVFTLWNAFDRVGYILNNRYKYEEKRNIREKMTTSYFRFFGVSVSAYLRLLG